MLASTRDQPFLPRERRLIRRGRYLQGSGGLAARTSRPLVILSRVVAFLDEEEQVVAPEEPERPRRATGPERRRQQYLLRRLIAAGAGVGFLILIVVGVRGCLEARSDRGLRNYTQDVGTIMQESQQRGEEFFDALQDPSGLTEQGLEEKISGIRGASASLLDRAENIGAPDQMTDAQSATTLALRLRRDALELIAANIGKATADAETADAIETISNQMGALYSSDVLWSQLAVPEIDQVLQSEDVEAQELPAGNFMPTSDPEKFLDETEVVGLITGVSGDEVTAGEHGLGLIQTAIGEVVLSPDSTTEVADDSREVAVRVQNQGESEENAVRVSVTVNGEELEQSIPTLEAGATETVKLQLTTLPQPGTETTVEVLVEPVPGEQVADNNEATYTVVFGSSVAG